MMKTFTIASCYIILTIFLGCSPRVQTVHKEVKVPVKCDVNIPSKPKYQDNLTQDLKEALIYSDNLEKILYFCVKGE